MPVTIRYYIILFLFSKVGSVCFLLLKEPDEGRAPSSDDYRSPASLSMLIRQFIITNIKWIAGYDPVPSVWKTDMLPITPHPHILFGIKKRPIQHGQIQKSTVYSDATINL